MLLVHRRDIVEAVEIRDRLQIGFVLDQLLGAAMKQADMRIDPLHHLAVEFKHEAQDAVRGRVLGPKLIVKLRSEGSAMAAETVTPGQRTCFTQMKYSAEPSCWFHACHGKPRHLVPPRT